VVLEGVLDRVPVERHVAVQAGVPLLQVEVLLDRAGERGGIVAGAVVEALVVAVVRHDGRVQQRRRALELDDVDERPVVART